MDEGEIRTMEQVEQDLHTLDQTARDLEIAPKSDLKANKEWLDDIIERLQGIRSRIE